MKAIIPAAGLGTRFLPVTKSQPKEMLPVVDKPVIQYVVEEAVAAGAEEILIVTGRGKRAIEDHFDRSIELEELLERDGNTVKLREVRNISEIADVFYVRQKRPKGLGHAVLAGAPFVSSDEPFFVLLGDVLVPNNDCLQKLTAVQQKYGGSVIAVEPVPQELVSRYGVIGGREVEPGVFEISELVEKPPANEAPSNLAIFGRYLLSPKVMEVLPTIEPGRGNEIQLTDALVEVLGQEEIYAVTIDCQGYDTGNILSWMEANVALALETEEFGPALRESLRKMLG
jgi:UTP--glucose-1-phosphate uridylyltransferase